MRYKKRKINRSLQNDEDNISLAEFKRKHYNNDPNSYDSLCISNTQACDFCEKVSSNRYLSFIHTAKHIIIPLVKLTVYQCKFCLHHFTSTYDLSKHQSKKHSSYEVATETAVNTKIKEQDRTVKSDERNIEKQEIFVTSQPLKCLNTVKSEGIIVKQEIFESSNQVEKIKTVENCNSGAGPSLKSRLLFEEDIISIDCDKLLIDLTTDCHVNVELFPPIWDIYPKAIHFEQLLRPGVYRCKKCTKMFPNRYEMIRHESQHIFIKNSQITLCDICNTYVLGDNKKLKHHKLKSHTLKSQKYNDDHAKLKSEGIICEQNSQLNHKQNGGFIPKQNGGIIHKQDGGVNHKQNGELKTYNSKVTTLKLCDLCLSFCKKRRAVYDCVGELSEIGKRYKCDECGYKFFCIKLVKRIITSKNPTRRNNKCGKVLSNETRLKLISNRFKMMKH